MVNDSFSQMVDLTRGYRSGTTDSDAAIEIKYIGTSASATVTVASGGDITLKHGAAASEAADTTIKLPTGGSAGVIDVSDTDANTFAEVVDHINASPNWRARLVTALRTDSSNDTLLAMNETTLNAANDFTTTLLKDTSIALNVGVELSVAAVQTANGVFDDSTFSRIFSMTSNATFTTGACTNKIYGVVCDAPGRTVTESTLYSAAGGATGVADTETFTGGMKPAARQLGYKMIARVESSGDLSAATVTVDSDCFKMPKC
jgi:hypothetical protein